MTTTSPTTQTTLTYAEYLKEPETMLRYDIVDGKVIMSAAPNIYHQTVSGNVNEPVRRFVRQNNLGGVWYAPVDVIVQQDPLRTRQPDLLFISNARAAIILEGRIHGGPDLAVEILSPSNSRAEIEGKLADYAHIGVRECWLIAPEGQTIEVLQLDSGEWKRLSIRGVGENVETIVLQGLELSVFDIFQGA